LIGCADNAARYQDAAAAKAVADRPADLPELPSDCRLREGHAALVIGQDARIPLRLERHALDREHRREDRCNGWYDDLKTVMGAQQK
jgi:hypothetical protein